MFHQLYRSETVIHARLVIKLSEEPPRWLVTFDEGSFGDEELAEEFLGPVVAKSEETEASAKDVEPFSSNPSSRTKKNKNNPRNNKNGVTKSDKSNKGSSSSSADENSDARKKKTVLFPHDQHQTNDSDGSSPNSMKKESSREQRSRRRQAMIEDDTPATDTKSPIANCVLPPSKKLKTGTNQEVVKVPMLTGTLFIYRGVRRRVEFIRKY